MNKAASIFSLFCGAAMYVTWGTMLATGQVPELKTETFETLFLLAAEFLTAASLLVGGFGLLTKKSWGSRMDLAALGMLLYCTIFSTGALGADSTPAAIFFGTIATLAFVFSAHSVFESVKGGTL